MPRRVIRSPEWRAAIWLLALALVGCGRSASFVVAAQALAGSAPTTCLSHDRQTLVSPRSRASASLVPTGARRVLLCRYTGLAQPASKAAAFTLATSAIVRNARAAARFARELDALPASAPNYHCPADFGDAIVATFEYGSDPGDPVRVGLSGCEAITNGTVNRVGLDAPVVSQLESLVSAAPK